MLCAINCQMLIQTACAFSRPFDSYLSSPVPGTAVLPATGAWMMLAGGPGIQPEDISSSYTLHQQAEQSKAKQSRTNKNWLHAQHS